MGELQRDKERAWCVAKRLKGHLVVVLKQRWSQNFKLGAWFTVGCVQGFQLLTLLLLSY